MSQVPGMTDGLFSISPDVYPGYLQLPQAQQGAPIPYSPEGWQAGKLAAPVEGEEPAASTPAKKAEKKSGVGFTPEQALALQKLTGMGAADGVGRGGGGGGAAPRNQVGQMQQLTVQGPTAPRASLGQIIYGGRKF